METGDAVLDEGQIDLAVEGDAVALKAGPEAAVRVGAQALRVAQEPVDTRVPPVRCGDPGAALRPPAPLPSSTPTLPLSLATATSSLESPLKSVAAIETAIEGACKPS